MEKEAISLAQSIFSPSLGRRGRGNLEDNHLDEKEVEVLHRMEERVYEYESHMAEMFHAAYWACFMSILSFSF